MKLTTIFVLALIPFASAGILPTKSNGNEQTLHVIQDDLDKSFTKVNGWKRNVDGIIKRYKFGRSIPKPTLVSPEDRQALENLLDNVERFSWPKRGLKVDYDWDDISPEDQEDFKEQGRDVNRIANEIKLDIEYFFTRS